jgi:multisubunit Na+/H+ antiporter MnhF subunit
MTCRQHIRAALLPALVVLWLLAFLSATGEPPPGVPSWAMLLLGAVLPVLFQLFLPRLPSWLKPIVAYGASGLLALGLGFCFLGWRSWRDILVNIPWLWAMLQFVYDIIVSRIARARKKKNRLRPLRRDRP